jgi:thymidylate kinase
MRFTNICLEGPDCSGKTTLFNNIHKKTNYKYNIQDRSCLSMYVFSIMYKRDSKFWYSKLMSDIKKLDTLYVVMLPPLEEVVKRIKKRGDTIQDENSIVNVWNTFSEITKKLFTEDFPNVITISGTDKMVSVNNVLDRINYLNKQKGSKLIKNLVIESKINEIVDVSCTSEVKKEDLDYSVLDFKEEKTYYKNISRDFLSKIKKELDKSQSDAGRRFIYSDDSCISMIHLLFRDNRIDFNVVMRSSNVVKTLWADYEFLKILSYESTKVLGYKYIPIMLNLKIRSAHIEP